MLPKIALRPETFVNLAKCEPSITTFICPVPESVTSTLESPSSILSGVDAGKFVSPEPSPKNDVAVTELIPDIFVELSPTILPFALILPETVAELKVPSDVIFG